ncbi:MAG TPA: cobalt ECF transporter T component CbiQ [Thermodesulfobacteriota bacterium]|nr:cobalt ECF transporter T component CbiQ [Thermodesulfobacteriota bacterium]
MKEHIPPFLLQPFSDGPRKEETGRVRTSYVNRGIEVAASVLRTGFLQWETASQRGFFQGLDSRIKVLFLIFFVIIVSLKKTVFPEIIIAVFLLGLALVSRLDLWKHYRKILVLSFIFGFLLTLPSALNLFSPGDFWGPVYHFERQKQWGPIYLPGEIGFTRQGLQRLSLLTLRVMNSLSISFLVLASTPFMELIKALKIFRVPDVFLLTITLAYKYIFIFVQTVYDLHLAKKSRLTGPESSPEVRKWASGRMAFLFKKSQYQCEEVFRAMTARGLSDTVKLLPLSPLKSKDYWAGSGLILLGLILILL